MEEAEKTIGEVEVFLLSGAHDFSEDAEEGSNGEGSVLLHDFLDFNEILFCESFHYPFSGKLIHAGVLR